jgi:hypothetical protein
VPNELPRTFVPGFLSIKDFIPDDDKTLIPDFVYETMDIFYYFLLRKKSLEPNYSKDNLEGNWCKSL